jgi:DNA (cytosine-5)-methyltransferase 1
LIRVLSLFSGIGAFEKALTRLGIDYEVVNYCEIDKYASCAYSAIHNIPQNKNIGDITKVDTIKLTFCLIFNLCFNK